MKTLSRRVTAVIFVVLVLLLGVTLYEQYTATTTAGPWQQTTSYPLQTGGGPGVAGQPCVAANSTVYCIGGQNIEGDPSSQIYSAPLSSSGVGNWTSAGSYPSDVMFQSCLGYGGYVYCLGGIYDDSADDIAMAYYTSLSQSALGTWQETTSYPVPADSQACVASSGYIYCLGGENETAGTNASAIFASSSWYAPISSKGIGTWVHTTPYPDGIFLPACTSFGGYIYCVGGETKAGAAQDSVYYAALSVNGIGSWTNTTSYPFQGAGEDCFTSSSSMYCVGGWTGGSSYTGDVYYAQLSPTGVGAWDEAGAYPAGITTSCVLDAAGYVYCVGGYAGTSGPVPVVYFGLLVPQPGSVSAASSDVLNSLFTLKARL